VSVRIDPQEFEALITRAGRTLADIARAYGCSRQAMHERVYSGQHVGPEVVRDLALIFADALRMDPDDVRSTLFVERPDRPTHRNGESFLQRRIAAMEVGQDA
jgi:hypothetical protein